MVRCRGGRRDEASGGCYGVIAPHLTKRCSRRLAGLFPSFSMIKILQEIATRAVARCG
jgi:hypothetical protein